MKFKLNGILLLIIIIMKIDGLKLKNISKNNNLLIKKRNYSFIQVETKLSEQTENKLEEMNEQNMKSREKSSKKRETTDARKCAKSFIQNNVIFHDCAAISTPDGKNDGIFLFIFLGVLYQIALNLTKILLIFCKF